MWQFYLEMAFYLGGFVFGAALILGIYSAKRMR